MVTIDLQESIIDYRMNSLRYLLSNLMIFFHPGLDEELFVGPMNTDVSEAILLGFYVVNDKLMWSCNNPKFTELSSSISDDKCSSVQIPREKGKFSVPLINRYTNGNVILPQKKKK